ncbi:pilus assembly PilX family protein [Geomobilimonas luticola]|uniref:Pilus assembly protein PilX n=1 Tax=Geomobilimonas luticola TaxID=1114878 RepID=A0ABS5S8U2_9BACT|nr:pilus assembly PilX N-terminal domain-containing protein [Geomobilimonas luticola]MBT0651802.1 pilus assembly protein PilX [Geomobilimonas luticola]
MTPYLRSEKGTALVIAMLFLMVLSILVGALHRTTISEMLFSRNYQESQKAFYAAETGLRAGMQWLSNQGNPPENVLNVAPYFSPVPVASPIWSQEFTDSINQCTYRYYLEHLKDAAAAYAGGESAKIGTSSSAGSKVHFYRITAEGISRDRVIRRRVQLVTTTAY